MTIRAHLIIFPTARFHLQELEMQYATGPHMGHGYLAGAYTVDHVVRTVYKGRVVFHTGDSEIVPGISVHHVGGHTMGVQCAQVMTERGWVVLASDASHFYANFENHAPFPIVYNAADMLKGFDKLRQLASTEDHIASGDDALPRHNKTASRPDRASGSESQQLLRFRIGLSFQRNVTDMSQSQATANGAWPTDFVGPDHALDRADVR